MQPQTCDHCNQETNQLHEIYMLDYSAILYRVCLSCKMSTFLCPVCLELRDQTEEYVNGHCIYETKAMKQIFDKLMELETRISALEN